MTCDVTNYIQKDPVQKKEDGTGSCTEVCTENWTGSCT